MSHGLFLVPRVCGRDLPCCRTLAFNGCYSDLIAWLCEGLCGRVVGETGTVSFLHRPEVSRRGQIRVASPRSSVPGSLALWALSCQTHEGCRRSQALWEALRRDEKATQAGQETFPRLHSSGDVEAEVARGCLVRRASSQALTSLRKRKSGSICVGQTALGPGQAPSGAEGAGRASVS